MHAPSPVTVAKSLRVSGPFTDVSSYKANTHRLGVLFPLGKGPRAEGVYLQGKQSCLRTHDWSCLLMISHPWGFLIHVTQAPGQGESGLDPPKTGQDLASGRNLVSGELSWREPQEEPLSTSRAQISGHYHFSSEEKGSTRGSDLSRDTRQATGGFACCLVTEAAKPGQEP